MIAQTERQFSDAIVELARLLGWLVHRDPTWRATGTDPGYVDLTLVKDGVLIFAELKLDSATSRLSKPQQAWLEALTAVQSDHVLVTVWRPSQWPEIEQVLQGIKPEASTPRAYMLSSFPCNEHPSCFRYGAGLHTFHSR